MASEYAKSLGARLRSIRQQQGLSLQGVEERRRAPKDLAYSEGIPTLPVLCPGFSPADRYGA